MTTEKCPKCGIVGPHYNTYGETDCRDRQIANLEFQLDRLTVEQDMLKAEKEAQSQEIAQLTRRLGQIEIESHEVAVYTDGLEVQLATFKELLTEAREYVADKSHDYYSSKGELFCSQCHAVKGEHNYENCFVYEAEKLLPKIDTAIKEVKDAERCEWCGAEDKPYSSNPDDHCHWVGKFADDLKGVRSPSCYERQLDRLTVERDMLKSEKEAQAEEIAKLKGLLTIARLWTDDGWPLSKLIDAALTSNPAA